MRPSKIRGASDPAATGQSISSRARTVEIATLIAGIAHEVNQPLCAIVANGSAGLRLLDSQPLALEVLRETLRDVVDDANRASQLVREAGKLFRRGALERTRFEIEPVVSAALNSIRESPEVEHVTVSTVFAGELPAIEGDPIEVQIALANLLRNAFEATLSEGAHGNEVWVEARPRGSGVEILVGDRGPGLASGDAERIFDAFHSSKPAGMGIGLAVSRSIVEAHGGRLWAETGTGHGAVFHLELPVTPP